MTDPQTPKFLNSPDGSHIAYHQNDHKGLQHGAGFIWCGGLKSDMKGGKATTLDSWASETGRPFTRFDYYGHGQSDGAFKDGNISRWRDDTLHVLDNLTQGPQILVGSSMGGWVSLLCAMARPDRVKGLLLIAPAPDFTQKLMWEGFDEDVRAQIIETGLYLEPSEYGEPYEITRQFIEDGRENQILDEWIKIYCPVRILQGQDDAPVPWRHSHKLIDKIVSDDVTYTLVKGGDHSLSRPQDLVRMLMTAEELSAVVNS